MRHPSTDAYLLPRPSPASHENVPEVWIQFKLWWWWRWCETNSWQCNCNATLITASEKAQEIGISGEGLWHEYRPSSSTNSSRSKEVEWLKVWSILSTLLRNFLAVCWELLLLPLLDSTSTKRDVLLKDYQAYCSWSDGDCLDLEIYEVKLRNIVQNDCPAAVWLLLELSCCLLYDDNTDIRDKCRSWRQRVLVYSG